MFYSVFSVNVSLLSAAVVAAATGCPLFAAALLLIAAAVVGPQAAYFYCGLRCTIAAPLPRAALLLLLRMQSLGRKIVCSAVLPSPRLELTTTPLIPAIQQLCLLGRTC